MTDKMNEEHLSSLPSGPLWRRLAAMAYDSILILAIWMVVTFVVLSFFGIENARTVEGETVTLDPIYKNILFLSMLVSAWAFFGWFWTHSGQTLGMQAWRLKVVTREGERISVAQSITRFLLAIPAFLMVGIGYFYMYLNPERETLHGKLSGTKVVLVPLMEKKRVD
jgi:uncharacterized RDD family membrane protein YckC